MSNQGNKKYPKSKIGPFYIEYTVDGPIEDFFDNFITILGMLSLAALPIMVLLIACGVIS
jgi:hypothetical protein